MGMRVDMTLLDLNKVKKVISENIPKEKADKLNETLDFFGIVHENILVLQGCDYWEEYDPWDNLSNLLDRLLINKELDGYDLLSSCEIEWRYNGADLHEWWANHFDDEDIPPHPYDDEE